MKPNDDQTGPVTGPIVDMTAPRAESAPRASGPITEQIRIRLKTPSKLRNLELALLVLAVAVSGGAIALVQLGALEALDSTVITYAAGLAALVLGVHIVLRIVAPDADPFILPIITTLNGLGIAMIYRLDIAKGFEGWESVGVRQMAWSALAMAVAVAVLIVVRNHRVLARYRYVALLVGIGLLLLPLVPGLGQTINGARVWIAVGPFSFQPGELGKIALAIFFAGYLMTARDSLSIVGSKVLGMRLPRARDIGPLLVAWAADRKSVV